MCADHLIFIYFGDANYYLQVRRLTSLRRHWFVGFKRTRCIDLPPHETTKLTTINIEGSKGDYGGIKFGNEEASLSEAFKGLEIAFGDEIDASEFIAMKKKTSKP